MAWLIFFISILIISSGVIGYCWNKFWTLMGRGEEPEDINSPIAHWNLD